MAEHAHVSSEVAWRQGAAWAKSAGTWSRLSSPLSEGQGCRGQRPTLKAPPPLQLFPLLELWRLPHKQMLWSYSGPGASG